MSDLFDYLRDILYEPEKAHLDMADVPPDQQLLAKGLVCLAEYLRQDRVFAEGLSRGDLDAPLPDRDNPLTGELRDLQGSLSHLVWQAEQVTKGDFSQRLDFMGPLSDAFNGMVAAIEERELRISRETEVIRRQNEQLGQSQVLLEKLMELMDDWVVVSSLKDGHVLHMNASCQAFLDEHPDVPDMFYTKLREMAGLVDGTAASRWELSFELAGAIGPRAVFEATSQVLDWDKIPAVVSILHDATEQLEAEYYAEHDSLTGLYNRRHAIERLSCALLTSRPFAIAFVDIDGLKYVNDEFGHEKGDSYIKGALMAIEQVCEPRILCRMGGDEFLVISYDAHVKEDGTLEEQLEAIRKAFVAASGRWPQSFSYGVVQSCRYTATEDRSACISAMLADADAAMYRYKYKNKAERRH